MRLLGNKGKLMIFDPKLQDVDESTLTPMQLMGKRLREAKEKKRLMEE
jgi:hypothetical protein